MTCPVVWGHDRAVEVLLRGSVSGLLRPLGSSRQVVFFFRTALLGRSRELPNVDGGGMPRASSSFLASARTALPSRLVLEIEAERTLTASRRVPASSVADLTALLHSASFLS